MNSESTYSLDFLQIVTKITQIEETFWHSKN